MPTAFQDSVFRNNLIYNVHASGISLFRENGAQGRIGISLSTLVPWSHLDFAEQSAWIREQPQRDGIAVHTGWR